MIVGLTGGIGSGKTTVANLFNDLGVPIYVTDVAAKRIMISDQAVIESIKMLLGNDAYLNANELNTNYISSKVFKSLISSCFIIHKITNLGIILNIVASFTILKKKF